MDDEQRRELRYQRVLQDLRLELTIQVEHGLPPQAAQSRGRALTEARRILHENGRPVPRTRRKCIAALEALMTELRYPT